MPRHWTLPDIRALGAITDLRTAADILHISYTTARTLASAGRFPTPITRVGRRWLIPVAGLLHLLDPHPQPRPPEPPTHGLDPSPESSVHRLRPAYRPDADPHQATGPHA